jgi:hypothetical protein
MTHDPSEYIKGLQQILVSDKKKIAFLFGAGTSMAKKNKNSKVVPAIGKMTLDIEQNLYSSNLFKNAIEEIKNEIGLEKYNVESLLSKLEQKKQVIGNGILNGLNYDDLNNLIVEIKKQIRQAVSIHVDIDLENVIHVDFAEWIGKADRKYPIEIFTTNYDYLFELGLEHKNIPYYDGFTGSYKPFFNSESVDDLCFLPYQTKLWKIHGSLGWHYDEETRKVWRKDSDTDDILIYPSTLKYNDSKKQPYTALGDRLSQFLKLPDTVLIICGYSFGDEHINERIITTLNSNKCAHIYVLCYDIKWEAGKRTGYLLTQDSFLAKLAKGNSKISIFACRSAVIGCHYGQWRLKREPDKEDANNISLYFDEDAPNNPDDEINIEKKGEEKWTGEGDLKISDFKHFVDFIQSMIFAHNLNGE